MIQIHFNYKQISIKVEGWSPQSMKPKLLYIFKVYIYVMVSIKEKFSTLKNMRTFASIV